MATAARATAARFTGVRWGRRVWTSQSGMGTPVRPAGASIPLVEREVHEQRAVVGVGQA